MKQFALYAYTAAALLLAAAPVHNAAAQDTAAAADTASIESYDMEMLISQITGVQAPAVSGSFVIFTAPVSSRYTGIAFDFENFRQIHSMQKLTSHDPDGNALGSVYFYILPLPKNIREISYRLIVDGLWTTDPANPDTRYDNRIGAQLSVVRIPYQEDTATQQLDSGLVRFTYQGEPGQRIRLGGTFTNWDSYIYHMTETRPGLYEISIPLLEGTYYYAFYNGITSFIDSDNPNRAYTADGRVASVIEVH